MIWKRKQFWGTVVAVLLLAYCLKDVRLHDIKHLSARLDYVYFAPATGAALLFIVSRVLRWRLILSPQKYLGIPRAIGLYSTGQILNVVMPALTGQVGRMFLFASKEGLKKTLIFSTIVLEILFDGVSLVFVVILASLAFAIPDDYRFLAIIISSLTVALLVVLYLILHYQQALEESGRRWLRGRWPGAYVVIRKFIRSFARGIDLLRSSQHLAGSLAYSIFSWLMHISVIFFLLKSFGVALPFATAAFIMLINTLALMVPLTPANAGTFEVAVSSTLR